MGGDTQNDDQKDEWEYISLDDDQEDIKKIFGEFERNNATRSGYTPSKNTASDIFKDLINKTKIDVDNFFYVWNNSPIKGVDPELDKNSADKYHARCAEAFQKVVVNLKENVNEASKGLSGAFREKMFDFADKVLDKLASISEKITPYLPPMMPIGIDRRTIYEAKQWLKDKREEHLSGKNESENTNTNTRPLKNNLR